MWATHTHTWGINLVTANLRKGRGREESLRGEREEKERGGRGEREDNTHFCGCVRGSVAV